MASSPAPPASKRDALLALLERGMVMLHLDARREGVQVPSYLGTEPHLRLNLSYRFLLDDLLIDDWGVSATLSFRGQPHLCKVPWPSLFALTRSGTDEGWLWPSDLPPELAQAGPVVEAPSAPKAPVAESPRPVASAAARKPPSEASKRPRPVLREVPPEPEDAQPPAEDQEPEPPRPPPVLRLIK